MATIRWRGLVGLKDIALNRGSDIDLDDSDIGVAATTSLFVSQKTLQ